MHSNIYPAFKAGDIHAVNNYNIIPVSLIPVIAKIFESLVHDQYFEVNGLLSPVQTGFHFGHSTQDFLLKLVHDWNIALDKGIIGGTVLFKLSKAFDSCN